MRVLISGAGIAGPSLAYWLTHYGHEVTTIEKAPTLRTGGFIIDFWGAGFDVAHRMGLAPEIERRGYIAQELVIVNRAGKPVTGFGVDVFTRATGGRYVSIPRGELAECIFRTIEGKVEAIFGDSIGSIAQHDASVHVDLQSGASRQFDIVIGADGLHSRVRELVFGPQDRYEKFLGYKVAAFEAEGYRPRDELAYVMYTEVHQQVGRFALRGDRTMFLFTWADDDPRIPDNLPAQKAALHERFANSGWECPRILQAMDGAGELYFDRVSQIQMTPAQGLWARGRVILIGDAAFCVSLLAGQGTALAMTAAYVLAGELKRSGGDYARAFDSYQKLLAPFIAEKQHAALRFAGFFAPASKLALFARNQVMALLKIPTVADFVFTRELQDKLALPDYDRSA